MRVKRNNTASVRVFTGRDLIENYTLKVGRLNNESMDYFLE